MSTLAATRDQTADDLDGPSDSLLPCLIHVLDRGSIAAHWELTFPLAVGRTTVFGRGRERGVGNEGDVTKVTLPDSTVSGRHATLRTEQMAGRHEVHVKNEGSRNGTFVNGQRVEQAVLGEGDWMTIGAHTFLFRTVPLSWFTSFRRQSGRDERAYLGQGVATHAMYERLRRIAPTHVTVLLHGASGTGKELVARELHRLSGRSGQFVGINCGAIPDNLIESVLFGHARGAFSGADQARIGLIATADQGTLLLDEIGDMPASVQVRLLRVLQEGEVLPIGENRPRKVDVRVVAASHRGLQALVDAGDFRGDLFARICGFQLPVPTLAERKEDLGVLFAEGLRRAGADLSKLHLSAPAAQALLACDWPYNVRQLLQVASVAAALSEDGLIGRNHLQGLDLATESADIPGASAPPSPLDAATALLAASRRRKQDPDTFRRSLRQVMNEFDGNVRNVADAVGVSRMQIYRWLKEIESPSGSDDA